MLAEAQKEIKDLMEEHNVRSANQLAIAISSVIADFGDLMIAMRDEPSFAWLDAWTAKHPGYQKLGRGFVMFLHGLALLRTIWSFLDWKELKVQDRVQLVIAMVNTLAQVFSDATRWKAAATLAAKNAALQDRLQALQTLEAIPGENSSIEMMAKLPQNMSAGSSQSTTEAVMVDGGRVAAQDNLANGLAQSAERWQSIAKVGEVFAEGMNILAMMAACVCTGFSIQDDFDNGQPPEIKALDIISEISNGVALLAEVGGLIFSVGDTIPIIGIVAAVVGFIVSFVLLWLPRHPEPSPAELFVDHVGAPFVTKLLPPSQDWLDQQQSVAAHLNPPAQTPVLAAMAG